MPTATFNKFNALTDDLGNAEHDWGGADVLRLALTNTLDHNTGLNRHTLVGCQVNGLLGIIL